MTFIISVIVYFVLVIGALYGLYITGRVVIPKWAEDDIFFTSPKVGRIKARKRSGRIVCFIDNLVGKKKHVNETTGIIESGEIPPQGFWWENFGARFIGLDDMYTYKIATSVTEKDDGSLVHEFDTASSIFLEGSYPITTLPVTADGVRLKLKIQLKTSTLDAAKGLSLNISWTIPMFSSVLAAVRDFCGARKIDDMISGQNEGEAHLDVNKIANSGFVQLILSLNDAITGNVSMADICGQHIDAVNIVDIDFADEATRKAFYAPYEAEKAAKAAVTAAEAAAKTTVIAAEAELKAAKAKAEAFVIEGEAIAKVYTGKVKAFNGDAAAASKAIVSENQSGMEHLTTLVNGGDHAMAIQPK